MSLPLLNSATDSATLTRRRFLRQSFAFSALAALGSVPGLAGALPSDPSAVEILMIGDWGTHMPDNAALLRQALEKFDPDVIIHLGDVYYSGTSRECRENVVGVVDDIVAALLQSGGPSRSQ